jgi:DNA-directed RNA polymerase subunit beta'
MRGRVVLLNRAPTLHMGSLRAFEPLLLGPEWGTAILLHPLVCKGFNADFDGDHMAVHLPLSAAAQAEARALLHARRALLAAADGAPAIEPQQDIVLGCYYLTMPVPGARGEARPSRMRTRWRWPAT